PAGSDLVQALRQEAGTLGFDPVGITSAAGSDRLRLRSAALERWLAAGHHGSMAWMEDPRRRQIEHMPLLAKEMVTSAVNDLLELFRAKGYLKRPPTPAELATLIEPLIAEHGVWLAESPRREEVEKLIQTASTRLVDGGWVE
ncbi:MAG: epoxyqueuosine reductase, partial [Phycisphaerae bacterium]